MSVDECGAASNLMVKPSVEVFHACSEGSRVWLVIIAALITNTVLTTTQMREAYAQRPTGRWVTVKLIHEIFEIEGRKRRNAFELVQRPLTMQQKLAGARLVTWQRMYPMQIAPLRKKKNPAEWVLDRLWVSEWHIRLIWPWGRIGCIKNGVRLSPPLNTVFEVVVYFCGMNNARQRSS